LCVFQALNGDVHGVQKTPHLHLKKTLDSKHGCSQTWMQMCPHLWNPPCRIKFPSNPSICFLYYR
jgi:hypothetical protein